MGIFVNIFCQCGGCISRSQIKLDSLFMARYRWDLIGWPAVPGRYVVETEIFSSANNAGSVSARPET